MSCTKIYWDNKIDIAELTPSSENENYPIENIQHIHRSKVFRTTGITSENIVIDFGNGNTYIGQSLIISKHNLTSSVTITLQGNATDAWGAPTFSAVVSTLMEYNTDTIIIDNTTATTAFRFWRIVIADATNPDTYLEIGRIFLGQGLDVDKSISDSFSEVYTDTTQTEFSVTGQAFSDRGYYSREYDLFFPWWNETMKSLIITMFKSVGKYKPVFFAIDKNNLDKIAVIYALITNDPTFTHINNFYWSSAFTIREVF